jgi:hypothetical protein
MTLPEVPPQVPPKPIPTIKQRFNAGIFFLIMNIVGAIIFHFLHGNTYTLFFILAATYWTVRLILWSKALEKLDLVKK